MYELHTTLLDLLSVRTPVVVVDGDLVGNLKHFTRKGIFVLSVTAVFFLSGPHPFPTIVRDFQSVIGREARAQILEQTGRLPDVVVACVGGGSNAIGMFHPFVNDETVAIVGVEAGGEVSTVVA